MSHEISPFERIAATELTDPQLRLVTEAMSSSVVLYPDDNRTRSVYMQGAIRVVIGLASTDSETTGPDKTTYRL